MQIPLQQPVHPYAGEANEKAPSRLKPLPQKRVVSASNAKDPSWEGSFVCSEMVLAYYCSRLSTFCGSDLACASIAVPACWRICVRVSSAVSLA